MISTLDNQIPLVAMPNWSWAKVDDQISLLSTPSDNLQNEVDKILELHLSLFGKSNSPLNILEVGCRTGKHLLEFAKKGHSMHGIETEFEYMDLIVQKQVKENLHTKLYLKDDSRIAGISNMDIVTFFGEAMGRFAKNYNEAIGLVRTIKGICGDNSLIVMEYQEVGESDSEKEFNLKDIEQDVESIKVKIISKENEEQLIKRSTEITFHAGETDLKSQRLDTSRFWKKEELVNILKNFNFNILSDLEVNKKRFIVGATN